MNRLLLYLSLYKLIFLPATIVTGICIALFLQSGYSSIGPVGFIKFFSLAFFLYFSDYRLRHRYYYYYNLGISRRQLIMMAIAVDILLFIGLLLVSKSIIGDKYLVA